MLAPVEESKMLKPFFASLSHLASVKVAASLARDFSDTTWTEAFEEIQQGNSTSTDDSEDNDMSRAKQSVLSIPPHLRMGVLKALIGLRMSFTSLLTDHSNIPLKDWVLYARSDGTIDYKNIEQLLVMNKNINIIKRFKIACNYCWEKSIQALWSEMEASGKIKRIKTVDSSMAGFWSNRMRHGSHIPWPQAVLGFIESTEYLDNPAPKFSSFFPLLQPGDRQRCFKYLHDMELDDFRLCLYSMTKEEQEKTMERQPWRVLYLYMYWPLQDLFLETAEKMWKYLHFEDFYNIVNFFMDILIHVSYFDYCKIFAAFWQKSPNHFRERVMKSSHLREKINSFFNEMERNRKVTSNCVSNEIIVID